MVNISEGNMILQKIKKDSVSLISNYENDLSSFLAKKRQQEGLLIKNSAIFTLSYARAYFSSRVSQFLNNLRESSDMEAAIENENDIARHIKDCALQYVQYINQNILQADASIILDTDRSLSILSGNEIVLEIDNSKFALDNGLDDCDAMTHQNCNNSTDLSTITPKFKSGSPKANITPYVNIKTPSVGKRPLKTISNLLTPVYTPDVNNNSTGNKSDRNEKISRSQSDVKFQGRKRLNFSESKENVDFMTTVNLNNSDKKNSRIIEMQNTHKKCSVKNFKHLNDENIAPAQYKAKLPEKKRSAECTINKIKDSETYASLEDDNSKNVNKHRYDSQKFKYFMENSSLTSKMHLRSFTRRDFYYRSDGSETPTSGFISVGNCFISPQSLMSKRLDFSKASCQLKKTVTKDFKSNRKNNFYLNSLKSNKVAKRTKKVNSDAAATKSTLQLSAKESPLYASNKEFKSRNISLASNPYCTQLNRPIPKEICTISSKAISLENTVQRKKKIPTNFLIIDKDESVVTIDCQSPPPLKKCRVTLTQSLVTPYPFMPVPSLGAPRKKRYSCRRSSPYCRRKLIKDFERLQIEVDLMDTPPGSPHIG